jgi:hypothetical protein
MSYSEKYQQLEFQIQKLQKEVQRLKEEEKAEQIDLSTCIMGQLVQLRNGNFEYYECKNSAGFYVVGGDYYKQDGSYYVEYTEPQYDVVKVFPAEIPVPDSFNVSRAKEVLEGSIYALYLSFNYADTPHGDQYWKDIYYGETNLSFGDMIFIQKWVIQSLYP